MSNKLYLFNKRIKNIIISENAKTKRSFIKGAILSIIFGLIVAAIIIATQGVNPLEYYYNLFSQALDPDYISSTMKYISVYMVAGLAVGIGFKCGIFNIGVAGQTVAGSAISIIIYKQFLSSITSSPLIGMIIFVICIISGALLGALAGLLKALFNIHEVVSTIMLNWIVWFFFQYFFTKYTQFQGAIGNTISVPTDTLTFGDNDWINPVLIGVVVILLFTLILGFTVFGKNLKAVGVSPTASENAGINIKKKMIQAMAISGAIAGIAGALSLLCLNPSIEYTSNMLPTLGFDSISIALVAFNNPIGIIFVGAFWGTIQSMGGVTSALYGLTQQTSQLIFGIIIYFAAISALLIRFAPWSSIKYSIFSSKSVVVKGEKKRIREVKKIKVEGNTKQEKKATNQKLTEDLKFLKANHYDDKIKSGNNTIKVVKHNNINNIYEKYAQEILNLKTASYYWYNKAQDFARHNLSRIKEYKKSHTHDKGLAVQSAKNWKRDQFGIVSKKYEKINLIIESKGKYNKKINEINEEILNLKSNFKMESILNHSLDKKKSKQELDSKIRELNTLKTTLKSERDSEIILAKEIHKSAVEEMKKDSSISENIKSEYNEMRKRISSNDLKSRNEAYEFEKNLNEKKNVSKYEEIINYLKSELNSLKIKYSLKVESWEPESALLILKEEQDKFNKEYSPLLVLEQDTIAYSLNKIKIWNKVNEVFNKNKKIVLIKLEQLEIKENKTKFIKLNKEFKGWEKTEFKNHKANLKKCKTISEKASEEIQWIEFKNTKVDSLLKEAGVK